MDRPDRAAEALCGLFVSQTFQVAEEDRQPEPVREPAQLLVKLRPGLVAVPVAVLAVLDRHFCLRPAPFAQPPPGRIEPRPCGDPRGDPIQPARDRIGPPDRTRLPRQHQEHGLRGILGVVTIAQDSPADVEHHGPVPLNQHGECRLGLLDRAVPKPVQQGTIGQPRRRPGTEQDGNVPENGCRGFACQDPASPVGSPCAPRMMVSVRCGRRSPQNSFNRRAAPIPILIESLTETDHYRETRQSDSMIRMTAPIKPPLDGASRWTVQTAGMDWEILDRMERAVANVRERLLRATSALNQASVPYAVVGGNAVASWVATIDAGAVRNTRDIDLLVRRNDLPAITAAMEQAGFVRDELLDVVMFRDGAEGKPSEAVHLVFAGERIRPDHLLPAPEIQTVNDPTDFSVIALESLIVMKLMSNRRKDQVHVQDLIDVGLIDSTWLTKLPPELADRLKQIIDTPDG